MPKHYQPNLESISTHTIPQWYHDSKFGIFIHWGIYSVPAFAQPTGGSEPFLLMSVGLPTILMQNGIAIVYVVDLAHLMSNL